MDVLIKNVDQEDWHFVKVEAVKEKKTMSEVLHTIIEEYRAKEQEGKRWTAVLNRRATLTDYEAKNVWEGLQTFRKDFHFRG